jgi:hypothetical protein
LEVHARVRARTRAVSLIMRSPRRRSAHGLGLDSACAPHDPRGRAGRTGLLPSRRSSVTTRRCDRRAAPAAGRGSRDERPDLVALADLGMPGPG